MELMTDPSVFGALKIVGATIAFFMAVPFIVGIVIGWLLRGLTR